MGCKSKTAAWCSGSRGKAQTVCLTQIHYMRLTNDLQRDESTVSQIRDFVQDFQKCFHEKQQTEFNSDNSTLFERFGGGVELPYTYEFLVSTNLHTGVECSLGSCRTIQVGILLRNFKAIE